MRLLKFSILTLLLVFASAWANDDEVYLAVSTTIHRPLDIICAKFSQSTPFRCKMTTAPTGHLYAHVMHGMAYDLFLSSDEEYTQGLINANKVDPLSRLVLALGKIVLWSSDPTLSSQRLKNTLLNEPNVAIALANPGASSYGAAAKEVLQGYNLWNHIQGRVIYGKNITHTYELIESQKASLGFVSLAQLSPDERANHHYWEPDPKFYKPVVHEVVALKQLQHPKATAAFMLFLKGNQARQILQEAGFEHAALSFKTL
jgi:molybdate transport system substrate-binding protein